MNPRHNEGKSEEYRKYCMKCGKEIDFGIRIDFAYPNSPATYSPTITTSLWAVGTLPLERPRVFQIVKASFPSNSIFVSNASTNALNEKY